VKKILIFLAPAMVAAVMYGCSKDHESPTFSKYEGSLHKPVNLVATYNKANDEFVLNWSMPDTNSVTMYNVAWSDSNVFDLGNTADAFTNSMTTEFKPKATETLKKLGYTSQYVSKADSFIVYFTVSAVYYNNTFNNFIGPRSDVDSALIYKK
jgi:hypothetical protein